MADRDLGSSRDADATEQVEGVPAAALPPGSAARRGLGVDLWIAASIFVILAGAAALYNLPRPTAQNLRFGWEYGNTAEALVDGRGYADPFDGVRSGPTAWMPPAYVGLLAMVFLVFGTKTMASLFVLLALKYAGIALALFILLRSAHEARIAHHRTWLVLAFGCLLAANRSTWFLALHDPWLVLLLSCAMVASFSARWHGESRWGRWSAVGLAAVLPVASPALAVAFVALEGVGLAAWLLQRRAPSRSRLEFAPRRVVLLTALFALSTLVWGLRNQAALGLFVPVKSNLWFDFYQANRLDDDGLVTNETFLVHNPSNPNRVQEEFSHLGEAAFTRRYQALVGAWVRTDWPEWVRRTGRRAVSGFLFLHDPDDVRPIETSSIEPEELEVLREAGLAMEDWTPQWVWLGLGRNGDGLASDWPLRDRPKVVDARRDAREALEADHRHWTIVLRSIALSGVPTIFLVIGMLDRRVRRDPLFFAAAVVYLVYLLPYVLVSHYLRYQTPMIAMQALMGTRLASAVLSQRS